MFEVSEPCERKPFSTLISMVLLILLKVMLISTRKVLPILFARWVINTKREYSCEYNRDNFIDRFLSIKINISSVFIRFDSYWHLNSTIYFITVATFHSQCFTLSNAVFFLNIEDLKGNFNIYSLTVFCNFIKFKGAEIFVTLRRGWRWYFKVVEKTKQRVQFLSFIWET